MRISDWSSDVCSSDLIAIAASSGSETVLDGAKQAPWTWFPNVRDWQVRSDAAYLHLCSNETIGGVEFADWPEMAALGAANVPLVMDARSEEHTSELQSLMRISYAVFCLKKKNNTQRTTQDASI